jgi:uncharacterized protein YidB (DUF937 family)
MGLLDSVLGGGNGDMLSTVINLIGGQKGGLSGLVSQFASNGLGDLVESWIGTGENKAVSAEQLTSALGTEKISEIASQLGTDSDSVISQLTDLLPKAVDKLTPEGAVPEGDILGKAKDLLSGLF